MARSTEYERSELGKTEISLVNFTVRENAHCTCIILSLQQKNPNWEAGDDANIFLDQLKESGKKVHMYVYVFVSQFSNYMYMYTCSSGWAF